MNLILKVLISVYAATLTSVSFAQTTPSPTARPSQDSGSNRVASPTPRPLPKATPRSTPRSATQPNSSISPGTEIIPNEESTEARPGGDSQEPLSKPVVTSPIESPEISSPSIVTPTARRLINPFGVHYTGSFLSIAVPIKHGPAISWNVDESWTVEANYFRGSLGLSVPFIDLGSFSESLFMVNARYFPGSSFNWFFGMGQQTYEAHIGNDIISRIPGAPGVVDLVKVSTLGVQVGFGNRWQWDYGLVVGVDWLMLNFPVVNLQSDIPALQYISNQSDRDRIQSAADFMRNIPTGAAFKVHLGYAF